MKNIYDVSISFKSTDETQQPTRDSVIAGELYDYLVKRKLRVFWSEQSTRESGASGFPEEIDKAIDSAKVMVVVGTAASHMSEESQWVFEEWQGFRTLCKAGRKPSGRIFSYTEGMSTNELPVGLVTYENVKHSSPDDIFTNGTRPSDPRFWEHFFLRKDRHRFLRVSFNGHDPASYYRIHFDAEEVTALPAGHRQHYAEARKIILDLLGMRPLPVNSDYDVHIKEPIDPSKGCPQCRYFRLNQWLENLASQPERLHLVDQLVNALEQAPDHVENDLAKQIDETWNNKTIDIPLAQKAFALSQELHIVPSF